MVRARLMILPLGALILSGCVAKTLVDVATLPVRGVAQVADWATTSQDEADRNRGREIRQREERLGELQEDYEKLAADCREGDNDACREAVEVRYEMEQLIPQIPVDPPEER